MGNINGTINFTNFGNLIGGSTNNTFKFDNSTGAAGLTGTITASTGVTQILDYSSYTGAVSINLANNTATGTAGFSNINQFIGNDGTTGNTSTLAGANTTNTWKITNQNAGSINTSKTFSGFGNLTGNAANDSFIFSVGKGVSGTIDAGAGSNTFDYSAYTTNINLNLANTFSNAGTSQFIGGSGVNTITGGNGANNWVITGSKAGSVNSDTTFSNFSNIIGGGGANTFALNTGVVFSGAVTGAGTSNVIDYTNYVGTVSVNLANNTTTGITTISNISGFKGNSTSTLTGPSGAVTPNTWNINTSNGGNINNTKTFSNFTNLVVGSGTNTFSFTNGGSVNAVINGAGSVTNFDYSAYTNPVTVNLSNNTATGTGGFSSVNKFTGNGNNSTLIGPNTTTTWNITGANTGNVNGTKTFINFSNLTGTGNANTIVAGNSGANTWSITGTAITNAGSLSGAGISATYSNIQNLVGGNGNDTFSFADGAAISGYISGGAGSNTADYSTYTTPVGVNLTAGKITTAANSMTYVNISNFIGGSGNNTLTGVFGTNIFNIGGTASNMGNVNGTINFTNFGNLIGGTTNNTFKFNNNNGTGVASITGTITAPSAGIYEALDYSSYTGTVSVNLANNTATGMAGFSGINQLIGNDGTTGSNSTIVGTNSTTTWKIMGQNTGLINSVLTYSGFGNLTGGTGINNFVFAANGAESGTVGGPGSNTFDYSAKTSALTVNTSTGIATGVGGFNNITNFIGGTGSNTLVSALSGAAWNITAINTGNINNTISFKSFNNLVAGGNTLFVFSNGAGVTGTIDGGSGNNTFDYSAYTTAVKVNLTNHTATGTGGYTNINNFIGSQVVITP
jgi:hypothetical protein